MHFRKGHKNSGLYKTAKSSKRVYLVEGSVLIGVKQEKFLTPSGDGTGEKAENP